MREIGRALRDALYWSVRNWQKLLPVAAVFLMVVILFGQKEIVQRQHEAQVDGCQRGNESRVANVVNLHGDIRSLHADIAVLREEVPHAGPSVRHALLVKQQTIQGKKRTIHKTITSQASVAVRPGSPVDACSVAYP